MTRAPMFLAVGLIFTLPAAADHHGAPALDITEWPVPWERSRPRDPSIAADGRIWFVGQADDYVAVFNPQDESFRRFELPEGAGPHTVYITRDQEIWYAGNRAAHLGRLDPVSGDIEQVDTGADTARDPHTLYEDSEGRIWFTSQQANIIGRYNRETGDLQLVEAPYERSRPYGIMVDDDDNAWVVAMGSHHIYRVDGDSFELTAIELPRSDTRVRRMAITDDGRIWYGDYIKGYLGAYDPATGEIEEWRTPGGEMSGPYAMTLDDEGRIWFVETFQSPNRFVGFDPETEEFFGMTPVPSGAGAVRHMVFDEETRTIWFGTDTNNLGRAVIRD